MSPLRRRGLGAVADKEHARAAAWRGHCLALGDLLAQDLAALGEGFEGPLDARLLEPFHVESVRDELEGRVGGLKRGPSSKNRARGTETGKRGAFGCFVSAARRRAVLRAPADSPARSEACSSHSRTAGRAPLRGTFKKTAKKKQKEGAAAAWGGAFALCWRGKERRRRRKQHGRTGARSLMVA